MDTPAPTRVSWHPPPDGSVKINFDGATFKDINKVGIGIVNQDGFGVGIPIGANSTPLLIGPG